MRTGFQPGPIGRSPATTAESVQQRRVRALNAVLTIYGHHVAQAADGMGFDDCDDCPAGATETSHLARPAPRQRVGVIYRIGLHSLLNVRSRTARKTMLTSHIAINCGWPI